MTTIQIPNGLEKFEQLSEASQMLKKAWESNLIDSIINPIIVEFSDKGKAVYLICEAKRKKKCLISWFDWDCNITEIEIENCKLKGVTCPFQTPEILFEKFKNMDYDINDFVKVEPLKIYPYKWVLQGIKDNLYTLSLMNEKVKILSFTYFESDLVFNLNNIEVNSELYNEQVKQYISDWLESEKKKIFAEKEILSLTSTNANKKESIKKEILISFKSTLTEPQLKKLFNDLKDGKIKFIHSETKFEQFAAIFENMPISNIKPVKWLKYKPQLFFLLDYLINKDKITEPESLYNVIENCFSDKHGKPFQNLKQSYNTFINITENIRFHDTINDILLNVVSA